jgi:succinyl-CoA synthetase beta subunit
VNIHEYQAKELLAQHGVAVPPGEVCDTPEAARSIAEKLFAKGEKVGGSEVANPRRRPR